MNHRIRSIKLPAAFGHDCLILRRLPGTSVQAVHSCVDLWGYSCTHSTLPIPIVIPAGYILRLDPIKWRLTYATRVFVPWVAFTLTRA